MTERTTPCYCGSTATLRSNALLYNGKEYGNGKAYICNRFPVCRGNVGTHPDGRPLGFIADPKTKELRIKVHAKIDPIWQDAGLEGKHRKRKRAAVYGWMSAIMGIQSYHTAEMTADDCRRALLLIEQFPYDNYRENLKAHRARLATRTETEALDAEHGPWGDQS